MGWMNKREGMKKIIVYTLGLALMPFVLAYTGDLIVPRQLVKNGVCSDSNPRVCVAPEYSGVLDELVPLAQRFQTLEDYGFVVPDEYWQTGLEGDGSRVARFSMLKASTALVTDFWQNDLLSMNQAECEIDVTPESRSRSMELMAWVELYARGGEFADIDMLWPEIDREAIRQVSRQPEEYQRQWVKERLTEIQSCHD